MDSHNIYVTLGASNHTSKDRQIDDYYATEPKATKLLLEVEKFDHNVLEPCCGGGFISEVLKREGYNVISSDYVDRGYGETIDFFSITHFDGDIITNPPFKGAIRFVKHALDIIPDGHKVAMFLRLQFLEGKERGEFYKTNPPKYIYVARGRLICAMNGDFEKYNSSAVAYCWFIWEKGFKGEPTVRWIN